MAKKCFNEAKELWPTGDEQIHNISSVVKQSKIGEFYIIGKITDIYCDVFDVSAFCYYILFYIFIQACPHRNNNYRCGRKLPRVQANNQRICWCGRVVHKAESIFYVRLQLQDLGEPDRVYNAVAFEKKAEEITGFTSTEILQIILSEDGKLQEIRDDIKNRNAVFKIIVKVSKKLCLIRFPIFCDMVFPQISGRQARI